MLVRHYGLQSNFYSSSRVGDVAYIGDRLVFRKKDIYALVIYKKEDAKKFFYKIGFSIKRKNSKLVDSIPLLDIRQKDAIQIWKSKYKRNRKEWVKKTD